MSTRARTLHATTADTHPNLTGTGGEWWVVCKFPGCGWHKSGTYRHNPTEPTALKLAHAHGTAHEHAMNNEHGEVKS